MMTFFEELRSEFAYRNGVRELSAALNKDLSDLIKDREQRHQAGSEHMRKPTLHMWADTDDAGKISIRLLLADYRKRLLRGEKQYKFPGTSYQEVAEGLSKLRTKLCEYGAVSTLVQSARPRLEAKHFGVAA
jgi:hypothetical protein